MAVTVTLFSFSKNPDSTARPTGGRDFDCTIISPSSVISPEIRLSLGGDNPSGYNYAKIPDFNRYYWITDWTYDAGIWIASLMVDVLATYRDQIGASSQYVLRAAAEGDGYIMDTLYPTTDQYTIQTTPISGQPFYKDLVNGEYILGVIGAGPSGLQMGAVTYYAMSPPAFAEFASQLFNDDAWIELTKTDEVAVPDGNGGVIKTDVNINLSTLKTSFNPAQYIVSCMWLPFVPTEGSAGSEIKLGWWSIPAGVVSVSGWWEKSFTVTVPAHPQLARGYYLHMPPYSRYTLYFPPFGTIPLDGSYFVTDASLTLNVRVDLISGQGTLTITTAAGAVIGRYAAQIGVPISVGQLLSNEWSAGMSALSGVTGGVASALTGDVMGAIKGVGSAIADAFTWQLPQVSAKGGNGSRAEYGYTPVLVSQFARVVDNSPEILGKPLCKVKTLSSIPGYIMVTKPEIELKATSAEIEKVKEAMRGGFFYV